MLRLRGTAKHFSLADPPVFKNWFLYLQDRRVFQGYSHQHDQPHSVFKVSGGTAGLQMNPARKGLSSATTLFFFSPLLTDFALSFRPVIIYKGCKQVHKYEMNGLSG